MWWRTTLLIFDVNFKRKTWATRKRCVFEHYTHLARKSKRKTNSLPPKRFRYSTCTQIIEKIDIDPKMINSILVYYNYCEWKFVYRFQIKISNRIENNDKNLFVLGILCLDSRRFTFVRSLKILWLQFSDSFFYQLFSNCRSLPNLMREWVTPCTPLKFCSCRWVDFLCRHTNNIAYIHI